MSSHHIVRDDQEPALILYSADSGEVEAIGQLLEWSPVVVVHHQALDLALAMGIKIEAVGSPENLKEEVFFQMHHQLDYDWINVEQGREEDAFLAYLIERGQKEAYFFIGEREEMLKTLSKIEHGLAGLQVIVCNATSKASLINAGPFSKFIHRPDQIQFIPILHQRVSYAIGNQKFESDEVHTPEVGVNQLFVCEIQQPLWVREFI